MNLFFNDYLLCYHDELFSINIGNNLSRTNKPRADSERVKQEDGIYKFNIQFSLSLADENPLQSSFESSNYFD